MSALYAATVGLIDQNATLCEEEEMYVILREDEAVAACAHLILGLARYARALSFSAEEGERRILLKITGARRKPGDSLNEEDLLPKRDDCRAVLSQLLRDGDIAYRVIITEETVVLTVAFPRFLVKTFDVCAVDPKRVCDLFFTVMLKQAGCEEKDATKDATMPTE